MSSRQVRRSGVFTDNFKHISHLSSVPVVDFEQPNPNWENIYNTKV